MKAPTMLMQILLESLDMYKKNTYSSLVPFASIFSNDSVDNANKWIEQIDDSREFLITAIAEYLENHKDDEVKPETTESDRVNTLEDEINFWKSEYDMVYTNYKVAKDKVTVLTNLIESYDKIQKESKENK